MDKETRNTLRNAVTQCRRILEEAVGERLEGQYGIHASGKIEADAHMGHLSPQDAEYRGQLLVHVGHIQAGGYTSKEAVAQLVREVAFTHLNRLVAYKMMERRGLIREAVSRGVKSQGFLFYLADHPEDERLWSGGQPDLAYRHFLEWLGRTFAGEIQPLFAPHDPANPLFPPPRALDEVLARLNAPELAGIWNEDETIGWVYQYFTPDELRREARAASSAPRNSYELAFRNQFYTPRYVVEFLSDNTLGRIWYEMRQGDTRLTEQCRYLVRRPGEVFLSTDYTDFTDKEKSAQSAKSVDHPSYSSTDDTDFTDKDEEKEKSVSSVKSVDPILVPFRRKKDPRQLKILDPAGGSGHFLLYCFDLLLTIYKEAYDDPQLGPRLRADYPTLADLRRALPGLILRHNLHLIDIDRRATQIAALALWLRAQRAYQEWQIPADQRPPIRKANIVCAEPMPGDKKLLAEFVAGLNPPLLGQLVQTVFEKMRLAGEAGSLLKIEVELREAIAKAKQEWEELQAGIKGKQMTLFTLEKQPNQLAFDLSGISDTEFWEKAERLVLQALADYASQAADGKGLARQLFTEDTVQGFGFVELMQQKYDVALTNPPFGTGTQFVTELLGNKYYDRSLDMGMAFIVRLEELLLSNGRIGALTSRTFIANDSLSNWRQQYLLGKTTGIDSLIDLGIGVLDDALVEVAAYTISGTANSSSFGTFINVLNERDKKAAVEIFFQNRVFQSFARTTYHLKQLKVFESVPGQVLCYWLPDSLLLTVLGRETLINYGGISRRGPDTGDDFRFLAAFWEVQNNKIGKGLDWLPFAKGGEYQPYYDDVHLVIYWKDDGHAIRNFTDHRGKLRSRPQGLEYIHKPGLTYPRRTTSDLSPRILPPDILFGGAGQSIFLVDRDDEIKYVVGCQTRIFKVMVEALVGSGDSAFPGSAANLYRTGLIEDLPHPLSKYPNDQLNELRIFIEFARSRFDSDETARTFKLPNILNQKTVSLTLAEGFWNFLDSYLANVSILLQAHHQIDRFASTEQFNLSKSDQELLNVILGPHPVDYSLREVEIDNVLKLWEKTDSQIIAYALETHGARRQLTKQSYFIDRKLELISHTLLCSPNQVINVIRAHKAINNDDFLDAVLSVVSFLVGCILGRWDIRYATHQREIPKLNDLFAPLPVYAPGMLKNEEGLAATETPPDYLIEIGWDGILVDDPDHPDDIIRRVQQVLAVIWGERAAAIEQEACAILGVKELRDYFRKAGKGGFWDDHVKRYSKSRRKAPIYWLLQSSKGNYALWLYYHRLDKDLYYKAIVNYVEPKLRLEENKLSQLQAQRATFGTGGKEAKQLDKELARQEALLSELRDFHHKLRAVAHLNLIPDLNDGVILNIAPLRELVPWKEAQTMWEELQAGKYEWSSVSQQLKGG